MNTPPPDNSFDIVRARIRTDLRAAMSAKRMDEAAALRTLIAALDNAEVVSVPPERYTARAFGDPATEVPRKRLSAEEVDAILLAEQNERLLVAQALEQAGWAENAERLRQEAVVVARYLAKN